MPIIKTDATITPVPDILHKQQEEFKKNPEKFLAGQSKKFGGKPDPKTKKFGGSDKKKVSWYINHDTVLKGDRQIADRGKNDGTRISLNMSPAGGTINNQGQIIKDKLKYDTIIRNNAGEAAWMGVQNHPQGADGMVSGMVEYNQGQDVSVNFQLEGLKRRHAKTINAKLRAKYEALLKANEGNVNVPEFIRILAAERQKELQALTGSKRYQRKVKGLLNKPVDINLVPKGNHSQTLLPQPYKAIDDNTVMYGKIVIPANDANLKEIKHKKTIEGSNDEKQHTKSHTEMQQMKQARKQYQENKQAFIDEVVANVSQQFSLALGNSFKSGNSFSASKSTKTGTNTSKFNSTEKNNTKSTTKYGSQDKTSHHKVGGGGKLSLGNKEKKENKPGSKILGPNGAPIQKASLVSKLGPLARKLFLKLPLGSLLGGIKINGDLEINGERGSSTTTKSGEDVTTGEGTKTIEGSNTTDIDENIFTIDASFSFENQNNINITDTFKKALTTKFSRSLEKKMGTQMEQWFMQQTSDTDTNRDTHGSKEETHDLNGTEYQHTVREKGKPYLEISDERKTF